MFLFSRFRERPLQNLIETIVRAPLPGQIPEKGLEGPQFSLGRKIIYKFFQLCKHPYLDKIIPNQRERINTVVLPGKEYSPKNPLSDERNIVTDSTKTYIPLPPDMKVPPGSILYYEMFFHQGQTTNTQTTQVLSDKLPYDSKTPLFAYQQLISAKVTAYSLAKDYVNEYDKNNPNGYCAYVKTLWYTDKATREEVTPLMKGISAPGVPSDF